MLVNVFCNFWLLNVFAINEFQCLHCPVIGPALASNEDILSLVEYFEAIYTVLECEYAAAEWYEALVFDTVSA